MATYRIIHYTPGNPLGTDVFKTDIFRSSELEQQFETLVNKLQPGESAEYMKEDEKYFYPSMAYVENDNGTLYSYTHKGHRRTSKYNR
ncbi:MAG TPA: hypothetical protein VGK47_05380 [Nitrososphaeraceae archaeon]